MTTTRRRFLARTIQAAGLLTLGAAVAGALPAAAANAPLAVGETVPGFSVTDQHGGMRNLATLAPNKGTVLIFTRSLHW